jgi:hypothetical protein
MKNTIILIICSLVASSCEIITINSKTPAKKQELPTQNTAVGAFLLFKSELDSNNISGALQIVAKPDGAKMTGSEKYDKFEEMKMLRRLLEQKQVTAINADTVNNDSLRLNVEFDYIRIITFSTVRIDNYWYISNYKY